MGNNTPKNNVTEQNAADQALIDGFIKHAASLVSLTIAATTVSNKDLIGELQARIDLRKAVQTTRATWKVALKAQADQRSTSNTFVARVRQALLVTFADQVDTLDDFGLTPRTRRAVDPQVQVDAAAKAKATREARHTMGPKQKAKIKGTVATTAPATPAPATPVATASPPSPNTEPTTPPVTPATSGPVRTQPVS
jgi:hypothetical protein